MNSFASPIAHPVAATFNPHGRAAKLGWGNFLSGVMKHLITVLVLITSFAAAAQEPPMSTYTKGDPGLRLVERLDINGSYAIWRGSVMLRGTLVVDLYRGEEGELLYPFGEGLVTFRPNAQSLRKLPRAVGENHPTPPEEIWVENLEPTDALSLLLGAKRAYELTISTTPRFEFQVELEVFEFGTSVDCDHRNYGLMARNIRLYRPGLVAMAEGSNDGC